MNDASNNQPFLRRGAVLALALLMAGCGALPDKPQRAALYDFGPALPTAAKAAPASPPGTAASASGAVVAVRPVIALADIDANSRLDGTQLLYRLGYADSNELRPYGQSRWSQPPAQLLRQRLREALAADHTVLGTEESATLARADGRRHDTLRITLDEFNQYFESPERSIGVVRVSATLLRSGPGGERVLAQRSFTAERPAPSNDGPGGVKALAAASDAVVAEVVAWVDQPR
ncbi:ABC-type transport auxiliary lipoprotein family protein [Variovorax sp. J22P168]|uniref:ABC-type transport auxiliary lipoprotein family protein n=1 Tax=Variovorax jilinensis TaxID=3053513 RepID=UPI0025772176|nr:ABC-type transport auxiliary lipoprotein family protein [Variovorax sp. J22P168]MDM0015739.1 ABC-type transport auxiliary lipoprotein family protein [Variovorax sp. J22P168]